MRVSAAEPTNKASTTAACAARGPTAVGSDSAVVDDSMIWWCVFIVGTGQFVSTPKDRADLMRYSTVLSRGRTHRGHRLQSIRIHVTDHKLRKVPVGQPNTGGAPRPVRVESVA